jgi:Ca2+:H+ antiporter
LNFSNVHTQVSTVALTRGEIKIVQSSMLGAVLSNILLVILLSRLKSGSNIFGTSV